MDHEGWSFEEEDDEGETFSVFPDRGIMNPFWVYRAIMQLAPGEMYLRGMMSFAAILESGEEGECYQAIELLDMQVQTLLTGEYTNPYDWLETGDEEDPGALNLEEFLKNLEDVPETEEVTYDNREED